MPTVGTQVHLHRKDVRLPRNRALQSYGIDMPIRGVDANTKARAKIEGFIIQIEVPRLGQRALPGEQGTDKQ
jgi:hypothetical protein